MEWGPGAGDDPAAALHALADDILTVTVLSAVESVTESMVYGSEASCEHWIVTVVVVFAEVLESVFVKVNVKPSFDPAP